MSAHDAPGDGRPTRRGDDGRPDASLAAAAAVGNRAAFETLYRRHAGAAWRIASAVAANPHDAADAVSDAFARVLSALEAGSLNDGARFRPYLLSATRNAAIDLHRRSGRSRGTDRLDGLAPATAARSTTERFEEGQHGRMVAEAFRGLPERWRSVLWLTEVEEMSPREAAGVLGLSANGVSQLAVRARAALRERFVQAHLREPVEPACRSCIERLGGYVLAALSPRDLARVDQHLAGCSSCRDRAGEIDDLRTSLRRIVVPLPLLLASASAKWQVLSSAAGTTVAGVGPRPDPGAHGTTLASQAQKPLVVASTALFALGVISASVLGGGDLRDVFDRRRPPGAAAAPPAQVVRDRALLAASARGAQDLDPLDPQLLRDGLDAALAAEASALAPAGAAGGRPSSSTMEPEVPAEPPSDRRPSDEAAPPAPQPEPLVNSSASIGVADQPLAASVGAGSASCTGATAGDATVGCEPPPPPAGTAGATVTTDGTVGGGILDGKSVSISL